MKRILSATVLLLLLNSTSGCFSQSHKNKTLDVGDTIPAFTLTDQDGKVFNSADHLNKNSLVIFFYPKDESLVCTKEACGFRDNYAAFTATGAVVVGINGGSVESHKNFQTHEKLPYPLLSDTDNKVIKSFGVPNSMFMTGRKTFVVDKTGKIVFTYDASLKGTRHAEEALAYLKKNG